MSSEPLRPGGGPTALRFLDVLVVLAATPFALAFGAPALGFAVGAATWIVQRAGGEWVARRVADDPRRSITVNLAYSMGRVWVLALIILLVGKAASRADGLTCALVVLVAFTISFSMNLVLRSQNGRVQPS